MAFGGKMNNCLDALPHYLANHRAIGDVPMYKPVTRMPLEVGEIGQIAGVSERIEVNEAPAGLNVQQIAHEVAADEPAAAGDKDGVHGISIRALKHSAGAA